VLCLKCYALYAYVIVCAFYLARSSIYQDIFSPNKKPGFLCPGFIV
jgi:hypothetical protein